MTVLTAASRRWWLAALVAVALAVVGGIVAVASSGRTSGELEFGPAGRAVPAHFTGFSIEYPTLARFMGLPGHPANPLLAQAWSGRSVRIGGNSADRAWPAGWARRPATVRFELTAEWWKRFATALREGRAQAALTLNLAARRPDAAAELLRQAHAYLPAGALTDIGVGNEPDLYSQLRWRTGDGSPTGLRDNAYRLGDFVAEQRAALAALRATGIPFSLTGPGFGTPDWRRRAPEYLAARTGITAYASHVYPLSNCRTRGARLRPADLLSPAVPARAVRALTPELAAARAARLPLVVQEGNSISCRGKTGVSDHPYAALWAADQLFRLLEAGADGYFFHAADGPYDPFAFRFVDGGWRVRLAPEYVGLLLFEHASEPGARLEKVYGVPQGVSAWATRTPSGARRVLLINRSTRAPARLTVPGARARELTVTTAGGLRVGGRTWPRWQAEARVDLGRLERTVRGRDGRLSVVLPAASAVALTIA